MVRTAYTRIEKKWNRIGEYYTLCHQFKPDSDSGEMIILALEKRGIDISAETDISERSAIYTTYQISDKQLLDLCNSLGKP